MSGAPVTQATLREGVVYVVRHDGKHKDFHVFEDGDEVVALRPDGTNYPEFRRVSDGETQYVPLSHLVEKPPSDLAALRASHAEMLAALRRLRSNLVEQLNRWLADYGRAWKLGDPVPQHDWWSSKSTTTLHERIADIEVINAAITRAEALS